MEGFPVEEFSEEAVRSQMQEAQKVASGSGSEQDIAEAKIELEVRVQYARLSQGQMSADHEQILESLQAAMK